MNMSDAARAEVNSIEELICGTIMVHLYDEAVVRRRSTLVGEGRFASNRKEAYTGLDQDDPILNTRAKIVKVAGDLPKEVQDKLRGKTVKVNYYSGKTYWKDDISGELLVLTNVEGILAILKSDKPRKQWKR